MKERAQVAQVEHGASGAELNDDMDLTIAPNSAPELTQTNTNTIQTNDPMDVDVADPATLRRFIAASNLCSGGMPSVSWSAPAACVASKPMLTSISVCSAMDSMIERKKNPFAVF